jgi:hypothetical protein
VNVDELCDIESIRQSLARYARGVDRQDLGLVLDAYWPDGWDSHGAHDGTPAEFGEFLARSWPHLVMQHTLGQSLIEVQGTTAHVETYFIAHHRLADGSGEYLVGGRYNDRFEKRDGSWRVLHRVVVFDWRKSWETQDADAVRQASLPAQNHRRGLLVQSVPSTLALRHPVLLT